MDHSANKHVCDICSAEFSIPLLLLGHKVSNHFYFYDSGQKRKMSSIMKGIFNEDTIYSSDSDCDYKISIERKPRIRNEYKKKVSNTVSSNDDFKIETNLTEFKETEENVFHYNNNIEENNLEVNEPKHAELNILNIHSCEMCGQLFRHKQTMKIHFQRVHIDGKGKLQQPKRLRTLQRENLTSDDEIQSEEDLLSNKPVYKCELCHRFYFTKTSYTAHQNKVHNQNEYKQPDNTNKTVHVCNFCGKTCRNRYNFRDHVNLHTGEKPHKCNICGTPFRLKSQMKTHILNHKGLKPHQCPVKECGKTFLLMVGKRQHYERVHVGFRGHKCEICDKSFKAKANLTNHMLMHTNEKPFACSECKATFRQRKSLKEHIRLHTGERPYKCNLCAKGFTNLSNLKSHQKSKRKCNPDNTIYENSTESNVLMTQTTENA